MCFLPPTGADTRLTLGNLHCVVVFLVVVVVVVVDVCVCGSGGYIQMVAVVGNHSSNLHCVVVFSWWW